MRLETAEFLYDDGTWDAWHDLPIRLYTQKNRYVAILWSCLDDLWLAEDESLPFTLSADCSFRWVEHSIKEIEPAIGGTIRSVKLGPAEMSVEGRASEIWTRLLIETDQGWLEIFNALDENGFIFHEQMPSGEFLNCV